jgi:hypothetical protein
MLTAAVVSNVGEAVKSTRRCNSLLPLAAIVPQPGRLDLLENLGSNPPRSLRDEQHRLCGDHEQITGSDCNQVF